MKERSNGKVGKLCLLIKKILNKFIYSQLFFAYHAKKSYKRKITTDANPHLPLSHRPTLTKARQIQVRTIRGRLPTGQDFRICIHA